MQLLLLGDGGTILDAASDALFLLPGIAITLKL